MSVLFRAVKRGKVPLSWSLHHVTRRYNVVLGDRAGSDNSRVQEYPPGKNMYLNNPQTSPISADTLLLFD